MTRQFHIPQVAYNGYTPLTFDDDALDLFHSHLLYSSNVEAKVLNTDLEMDVQRTFDYEIAIFKNCIKGIEMGYSTKKDKYELTINYGNNEFTIVFESKQWCKKIFKDLIDWRNEQ